MSEWISVKDRLPPVGVFVDVRYDVWRYKVKIYTEDGPGAYEGMNEYTNQPMFGLDVTDEDHKEVTHWMAING